MRLQPQDRDFTSGPVVATAQELMAWLAANDGVDRPWFRLAVEVCFADEYRLAIGSSHVVAGDDRLAVFLDGGRMSLSLLDELRFRIPESERCGTVWIEGQWEPGAADADGTADDRVVTGDRDTRPRIVARRVKEPVDPAADGIRPSVGRPASA